MKKLIAILLSLTVLVGSCSFEPVFAANTLKTRYVTIERIIDGDTVVTTKGEHVRLSNINTPEKNECGGSEATAYIRSMVPVGARVRLVGTNRLDKYGRSLGTIYVGKTNVNLSIVSAGWARTFMLQNDKYKAPLLKAELAAKVAKVGVWSLCGGF